MNEDLVKTKMAISLMLILPRIPQILYGTEILMQDTANPGDHGLIRTDFPGGWNNDKVNAFTQQGLQKEQIEMQEFLKKILKFRRKSSAIHKGKTIHFSPKDGIYLLFRINNEETTFLIINKNESSVNVSLDNYSELDLKGKIFKNIISNENFTWDKSLELNTKGVYIFSTNM